MSGRLHGLVRRWWRGEGGAVGRAASWVTAPLEWLYAREVSRRNAGIDRDPPPPVDGLAVVSVGNLTVGGTGKTPMAAWVVRTLADEGVRVALLSRGYGGDEILLHRRWNPGVPVLAHPDRVAAARDARARGARVVVLDDGFQHRRLRRDVDLVLLAAEDVFPGRLLPRGPYREGAAALGRAHGVIVTRRVAAPVEAAAFAAELRRRFPHLVVGVAALVPGPWQGLDGRPAPPPEGALLAAAGVARPEAFSAQVEAHTGRPVELAAFPDHHAFSASDAGALRARAGIRTVVVTEKDAVKLSAHAHLLGPVRVLSSTVAWEEEEAEVRRLVTNVVAGSG